MLYACGALVFWALAIVYGYARWIRRQAGSGRGAFPLFAAMCAVAFTANLAGEAFRYNAAVDLAGTLSAALIAPLLAHAGTAGIRMRRGWRATLVFFYVAAGGTALARWAESAGFWTASWSDALDTVPAAFLGTAAVASLILRWTRREPGRLGSVLVLGALALCSLAAISDRASAIAWISDYLLLAFFCLELYRRERLAFFDVLVKRGVFALVAIPLAAALGAWARPGDEAGQLAVAGSIVALWSVAPWLYGVAARGVDRRWLSRPFSFEEAQRLLFTALHSAGSEDELRLSAERSLSEIFQTEVAVRFSEVGVAPSGGSAVALSSAGRCAGWIRAADRRNGLPLLSHDLRLLETLAGALTLALENVRFRAEREEQQLREHELRLLASRAELRALRAQIDPHFLFNSLSVIGGLVHSNPALADATIENLAEVFRYTLRKSQGEWCTMGDELEFVTAYLGIEKARFGDPLDFEIDAAADAAPVRVPAMCLQPLVENAIRHGVFRRPEGGRVRVRCELDAGRLRVEVMDTGPGFREGFSPSDLDGSHGLGNVAARLKGYFGDNASLRWQCDERGTSVMMTMPAGAAQQTKAAASSCA